VRTVRSLRTGPLQTAVLAHSRVNVRIVKPVILIAQPDCNLAKALVGTAPPWHLAARPRWTLAC